VFPRSYRAALTAGGLRSTRHDSHRGGPPCLDAGFHTRSVPPSPFLTTLTAYPSSDPVECFVHSRPWGSVPAPCSRPPVGWSEDRPSRCVSGRTSPKFVPVGPRGRVFVQEAPGRLRARQLPKHPSELRGHRSVRSRSAAEATLPSRMVRSRLPHKAPCLLRVLTTEAVIRPDCRSLQAPSEDETLLGRRGGEPSRPSSTNPCGSCLSYPVRSRTQGFPGTNPARRERVRTCDLPKETVASNPPALPVHPPLDE
jgi:hypothetical protein